MAAASGEPASAAAPVDGRDRSLIEAARAADVVLLGEATHGTSEFYLERAEITRQLTDDARPAAVVIEADNSEVERANRYVRGIGPDRSAAIALSGFRRFPRWMWRNAEFASFLERLRERNLSRPEDARVGLYGMDVYDLYAALDRARIYLRGKGAKAAAAGEAAARCFAPYRRSTEAYGIASRRSSRTCAAAAGALLDAVTASPPAGDTEAAEERFGAIRAAASVVHGEAYFRAAYAGAYSWNVRERAMAATIGQVAEHASNGGREAARIIVWTHNSHAADAASTTMVNQGETTIATLLREGGRQRVFSVGLLTYAGTFMAAAAWDRPGQMFRLAPAARNSVEGWLRRSGEARSILLLGGAEVPPPLAEWRPQLGIGAVFSAGDGGSTYSSVRLATEFDAVLFVADARAATPLP